MRAVGSCVNIVHEDRYVQDEIPALSFRVEHRERGIVHTRLPYEILADGTIRFGEPRIVRRVN